MSEVSFVSGGGGGGLKRSRVYKKSYPARKQAKPTIMSISRPLKLNGEYKLSRMTSMYIPWGATGFSIGGVGYLGIGLLFNPGSVDAVSTLLGGLISANIPNYAEISALWDRVMIEKVVIEMNVDRTDPAVAATGSSCPVLYYAYDNTDVYGNNLTVTQQQDNCKSFQTNSNRPSITTVVYPSYQRVVYYTSALSSYEPARGFVVSDTAIPHYGLRLALDTQGMGTGTGGFRLRFTYHYRCKGVK